MPHHAPDRDPLGWQLILTLGTLAGLMWAWFLVGGLEYAYRRIGIPEGAMLGVMIGSLAGSAVNLPIGGCTASPGKRSSGSSVDKLASLGGGVASIGGAGTFDGVFLSGIVAVLLVTVT